MEAAIFVSIPEYMLGVGRLRVVGSYVHTRMLCSMYSLQCETPFLAREFHKILKHTPLVTYHSLRPWLATFSAICFAFKLLPFSVFFKSV